MISILFDKLIQTYLPKIYELKKIRNENYFNIFYKFNFKLNSIPNFPINITKIFNLDIKSDYIVDNLGYIELESGEKFCGIIAEKFHIKQFNYIKDIFKKKILKENYLVALDIAKRYQSIDWLCKKENEIFKKNCGVFIEVGSYLSYKAIRISKEFFYHPNSKILCFEIDKDNVNIANKNIKLNNCKNIKNFNLAISNSNTTTEYYSKARQINSLENIKNVSCGKKKIIQSIKLDDIIEKKQIKKIDFIHITVNGSENKVLEGISNNIKKVAIILLVSQYIDSAFKKSVKFLKKNNFTIEIINQNTVYAKNNIF
jgi:FkbM family methyltransferase